MARVTIEDCLQKVDSRFSLVHLAVRRVLQRRSGSPLLFDEPKNKEIVMALREIAAGKVTKDNIRELEENKALPEKASAAAKDTTHQEVQEIVEAATQFETDMEFKEKADVTEAEDLQ